MFARLLVAYLFSFAKLEASQPGLAPGSSRSLVLVKSLAFDEFLSAEEES